MNKPLLAAAVLAALTTLVHLFAGGADIAGPLLASTLAEEPRLTLYAVWHMATVALALSAIGLAIGATARYAKASRYLVRFISALWFGFGLVFLVIILTQPGRGLPLKLPQWMLLLPVGALGLWGDFLKDRTSGV